MESKKILIVDDDPDILTITGEILEENGFEVVTAVSVPNALAQLKEHTFLLVILDINLQTGRGNSVEKYMRQKGSEHFKTPTLYISGSLSDLGKLPPNTSTLSKPFSNEQFFEAVISTIKSSRSPKAQKAQNRQETTATHPNLAKLLKGKG